MIVEITSIHIILRRSHVDRVGGMTIDEVYDQLDAIIQSSKDFIQVLREDPEFGNILVGVSDEEIEGDIVEDLLHRAGVTALQRIIIYTYLRTEWNVDRT